MHEDQAIEILTGYVASDISKLARFFTVLAAEIDQPRSKAHAIVYDPDAPITIDGRPERQGRVTVYFLRPLAFRASTPALLIDASAEIAINRRLWGTCLQSAEVEIGRHAVIVQTVAKGFSNQSLTGCSAIGAAWRPNEAKQLRGQLAELIKRQGGAPLIGANKAVEESLKPHLPGTSLAHFGAIRGRNDFQSTDTCYVIGREQPSPRAIESYARALFSSDPDPLLCIGGLPGSGGRYVLQARGLRMEDGSAVPIDVEVHPDPRCQLVLEQIREREIEQLIDRLRLIHNEEPKRVFVLSEIVCDLTISSVTPWRRLARERQPLGAGAGKGGSPPSIRD
jgi:hypothetical protein